MQDLISSISLIYRPFSYSIGEVQQIALGMRVVLALLTRKTLRQDILNFIDMFELNRWIYEANLVMESEEHADSKNGTDLQH